MFISIVEVFIEMIVFYRQVPKLIRWNFINLKNYIQSTFSSASNSLPELVKLGVQDLAIK